MIVTGTPTLPANQIMDDDPDRRYRVLRVEGHGPTGTPYTVAGFFEPVTGLRRGEGAVAVYRDGALMSLGAPVGDHPMAQHFGRVLDYFQDRGPIRARSIRRCAPSDSSTSGRRQRRSPRRPALPRTSAR